MPDPTGESLAAALDECGFRFYGDMAGAGLFACEWNDAIDAVHDGDTVFVAWGPTNKVHGEIVRDARRLRELVEALKVVYGTKPLRRRVRGAANPVRGGGLT